MGLNKNCLISSLFYIFSFCLLYKKSFEVTHKNNYVIYSNIFLYIKYYT